MTGAQIVLALQTIQGRQVDVTKEPSVLTIGAFNGGNRPNIIPDKVEMLGTLRTFDQDTRDFIVRRVKEIAEAIAQSGGAEATVERKADGYIPLVNNVALTQRMVRTLRRVAGANKIVEGPKITASEDFSFYAKQVPGLFFDVGITPAGVAPFKAGR